MWMTDKKYCSVKPDPDEGNYETMKILISGARPNSFIAPKKEQKNMIIAPNLLNVTANILGVKPYVKQDQFSVLELEVTSSKAVANKRSMPGAQEGHRIKAIMSNDMIHEAKLNPGDSIACTVQKVSLDLWRVNKIEDSH